LKNILIVATQPQRFLDQLNLAKELDSTCVNFSILFFIGEKVSQVYKKEVKELEFKIINNLSKLTQDSKQKISIKKILKTFVTTKKKASLRNYINILKNTKLFTRSLIKQESYILNELNKKYEYISKLVVENKIKVLLINGDRHLGDEPVFLKISKELGVPSIIVYLVDYADEERILKNKMTTKKLKPSFLTSRYIVNSQEKLKYKIINNKYYYPHPIGNALQKFGVITKDPYVMGSGASDILCLNNKHSKDLYQENGINEKKIRVMGDASSDRLHGKYIQKYTIKKELLKKYNLSNDKRTIVIALPQLGEHNLLSWEDHWIEIFFLMSILKKLEENVLISLHPKMDKKEYQFLESKFSCNILDERLTDVLPIADVFIATFSSTVIWSVLCGVKTIVVDFYGLNYTMYDFLTSIKIVDDKKLLQQNLKEMLYREVDFSKDWESLSRDDVFDGKTTQRYIELIDEVIDS